MRFVAIFVAMILAIGGVACSSDDNKPSYNGAAGASPTVAPPPLATVAAAVLSGAPGGSSQPRVNGTVQTASAGQVTLSDGTSFQLAPNARIARLQTIESTDLKAGQFVAITAKRQPDN